jgi:hypothetical protein
MPFAIDEIEQAGGIGRKSGIERCRVPLVDAGLTHVQDVQRPRLQRPVFSWRFLEMLRQQPGKQPNQERKPDPTVLAPEPQRQKAGKDRFEGDDDYLTGSPFLPKIDREGWGTYIEPADPTAIGKDYTQDTVLNDDMAPQPAINDPLTGIANDTAILTGNTGPEARMLHAVRMAYPGIKIAQLPTSTRTVPLTANQAAEIMLPPNAVLVRFAISGAAANDYWVSLNGNARIPQTTDMGSGNESVLSEGLLLNPDPTLFYYCKGRRQVSAICANNCFLNVSTYIQG